VGGHFAKLNQVLKEKPLWNQLC